MQSLLIIAHGSRRDASNEELYRLIEKVSTKVKDRFGYIGGAFLEIASPSIPEGIQNCIDKGATEIIVFPYFLAAGNHVIKDIPAAVEKKRVEYPEVKIKIADYLGSSENMATTLLEMLDEMN